MERNLNLKQQLSAKAERDGLTEIFFGVFLFLYSDLITTIMDFSREKASLTIFILIFAFSGNIINFIRKRITYSETGYVGIKSEIKPLQLYLVIFPFAFYPLFIGIMKYVFGQNEFASAVTYFSPIVFGTIFFFLYLSMYKSAKNIVILIFAIFSPVCAVTAFLFNDTLGKNGYALFFTVNGILLIVYGLVKLFSLMMNSRKNESEQK